MESDLSDAAVQIQKGIENVRRPHTTTDGYNTDNHASLSGKICYSDKICITKLIHPCGLWVAKFMLLP